MIDSHVESVIAAAEIEFATEGVLSLTTIAELLEAGIDPESIQETE